jgi:hypothetical protein
MANEFIFSDERDNTVWFNFIDYFEAQCHDYEDAGGDAFIAFWIPSDAGNGEGEVPTGPYDGLYTVFANLTDPDSLYVELWRKDQVVMNFTIDKALFIIEYILGSAMHPDPWTPLGERMSGTECHYEHAAIRLVAYLASVLQVSENDISNTRADWVFHTAEEVGNVE